MVLYLADPVPSLLNPGRLATLLENEVSRAHAQHEEQKEISHETMTTCPRYQHLTGKSMDIVTVELPGVEKENVILDVKEHLLHLSAERVMPDANPVTAAREHSSPEKTGEPAGADGADAERRGGSVRTVKYVTAFSLGKNADVSGIQADYSNGLLTVKVPHRSPEVHRVMLQ